MNINKHGIKLQSSVSAVITLPLNFPGDDRIKHVASRVEKVNDFEVDRCLDRVMGNFAKRHRNIQETFLDHFRQLNGQNGGSLSHLVLKKKILLGALFTKEYSIQSAALFNPSIVPHPDQGGLNAGELRFVMSLRATGEGHISSVVFLTGVVDKDNHITLQIPTGYHTRLQKNEDALYDKEFCRARVEGISGFNFRTLDLLPESFTACQGGHILKDILDPEKSIVDSIGKLEEMLDSNYELKDSSHIQCNEKVIFPNARAEIMGIEDLRLVRFDQVGGAVYYGTFTAYDGMQTRPQLLETRDFNVFKIRTLYGAGIADKGMALFPEKVNGKFAMISRQGGENISIMFSGDLYRWERAELLMEPSFMWELLQVGNCGSPIKTDKGWLLLTHGVGPMRTYSISAILLDLNTPSRIIGRLDRPILEADESEREGYVPNVVYTCGFMLHQSMLIIPYSVSDSVTCFATLALIDLLNEFKL